MILEVLLPMPALKSLGCSTYLILTRALWHQPYTFHVCPILLLNTNVFILAQDLNIGHCHSSPLYQLVR
jgi:hypothetical protein